MNPPHTLSCHDFARAADHLYRGQLAAADGWCRRGLTATPDSPAGLNLLGCIAALAGLHDAAARSFERALPLAAARDSLGLLSGLEPPPLRTEPGFILIKSWGYGFCSELAHVLGGLLLAELTGRIPVVQWGRRCLFSENIEGFRHFFEPVSAIAFEELALLTDASLFPASWSLESLSRDRPVMRLGQGPTALECLARPETILVCDNFLGVADLAPWSPPGHRLHGLSLPACYAALADTYLRPRPEIAATAAAFRAQHFAAGPITAVHLRGSDKVLELPEIAETHHQLLALLDTLPAERPVFLMTDDDTLAHQLRARYGPRLILTDSQRTRTSTGIHYHQNADGPALGREMMVDLLLALEAEHFIGNGRSNVSALLEALRSGAGRHSTLVLENQLYQHSCFL